MTLIGLAGDWHGSTSWVGRALPALRRAGISTLLHVGDFGFWPGASGRSYLKSVEHWASLTGIEILVTPGNHEDYEQIHALFAQSDGHPVKASPHVTVLPRGHRWTIDGRSFLSLGGAASFDHHLRKAGVDWWPQEAITDADVDLAVAGGPVDVLITHDAPLHCSSRIEALRNTSPDDVPNWVLDECRRSTLQVERVTQATLPKLHAHGHWHLADTTTIDAERIVLSLDKEFTTGNLVLLNTEDLSVQLLEDPRLLR